MTSFIKLAIFLVQMKYFSYSIINLVFVLCTVTQPLSAQTKPKIGLALPLSGSVAFLGNNSRLGIDFFLEEYPQFAERVQFFTEDMTERTAHGVSGVKKLIEINRVDVLILEMSPVANAVGGLIDSNKIPTIAIVGAESARGRSYMVKLWIPAANEAKAVVKELLEKNITKVALLTSEQDAMLARTTAFRDFFPKSQIVLDETVVGPEDLGTVALRVQAQKPEAVVMNFMPGIYGPLARKLRQLGYKGDFFGTVVLSEPDEIKLAEGALKGARYPDSAFAPDFVTKFKAKHGRLPPMASANAYDAMLLLKHALDVTDYKADSPRINELIRVKHFKGALGEYSFTQDGSNNYDLPATLMVVE